MKRLALLLGTLALGVVLQAQSAPPSATPTAGGASSPWQPRPVIIINPADVLRSPSPAPHRRPTPRPHAPGHRVPLANPTPEVFERYDSAPSPTPTR